MSLKFGHNLFARIDQILPRRIAASPYSLCLFVTRYIFNCFYPGSQLWPRHSYQLGTFVFGLSDLDLSLILPGDLTQSDFSRVRWLLRLIKVLFPFLGEINLFDYRFHSQLVCTANPYEVARDPLLFDKFSFSKSDESVDKCVYILRNLMSDRLNLITRGKIREKKWRRHFFDIGEKPPTGFSPEDFKVWFSRYVAIQNEEQNDWIKLLEFLLSPDFNSQTAFRSLSPRLWRVVFPHCFLWGEVEGEHLLLTNFEKRIMARQIEWEIWGISTQGPVYAEGKLNYRQHLQRLLFINSNYLQSPKIETNLKYLLDYLDRISKATPDPCY